MDGGRRIAAYALIGFSAGLLIAAVLSWNRLVTLATRIPPVPLVLVLMSAGCAVAADQLYRRTRSERQRRSVPRIRWWWVVLAFAAVLVAVSATTALLMPQTFEIQPGSARLKQEIEVVRTGLAAGAGVGAAITVLLAFRRQQHHEEATERTDYDASERRITELYTKAVEQLGSPQAPVRLGGLYALERLGQAVANHRQTIVDVICAYLRMPYTPPATTRPIEERQRRASPHAVSRSRRSDRALIRGEEAENQSRQELQVRETAQRILSAHLCDLRLPEERETIRAGDEFWEGMHIDLAHATLTSCDFSNCHVAQASFAEATFTGPARFGGATFSGPAQFGGATFTHDAWFRQATFTRDARFDGAIFAGHARFEGATFTRDAWFDGATFALDAWFGSTFTRDAWFRSAIFTQHAWFQRATFSLDAWFEGATFTGDARFGGAAFTGNARFGGVTFAGLALFGGAAFTRYARFDGARTRLTTPEGTPLRHHLPAGWDIRPTSDGWGTLMGLEAPDW
ncbi:pentapeptide repeat-containing protein [Streptomyces spororaveus]|uniref:pentapeptide repeat-containing protein n=1 Tax=Streptomyces spororaveus TaxID=284039 RepID=UPI00379F697F